MEVNKPNMDPMENSKTISKLSFNHCILMDPAFGQMNLHLDLLKPDSKVLGKLQSHRKASKCVSICKSYIITQRNGPQQCSTLLNQNVA